MAPVAALRWGQRWRSGGGGGGSGGGGPVGDVLTAAEAKLKCLADNPLLSPAAAGGLHRQADLTQLSPREARPMIGRASRV